MPLCTSACCFVEIHIDSLQLQITVPMVRSGRVDSMLVRDNFPELGTHLVTTLASLNVNDLAHLDFVSFTQLYSWQRLALVPEHTENVIPLAPEHTENVIGTHQ